MLLPKWIQIANDFDYKISSSSKKPTQVDDDKIKILIQSNPTASQTELYQRRVMLLVWWDWYGVVHFELQPRNIFINLDVYSTKMWTVWTKLSIRKVRSSSVVFHHDKGRPHNFWRLAKNYWNLHGMSWPTQHACLALSREMPTCFALFKIPCV